MAGIVKEFKEFAIRGNMVDLAVGVIIGGAFNKIITSIVNDLVTPFISLITGQFNFSEKFISLGSGTFETVEAAKAAGVPIVTYGSFIQAVIDFILTAIVIFVVIKQINRFRRKPEVPATTKACPECTKGIPINAKRCPECTADLRTQ